MRVVKSAFLALILASASSMVLADEWIAERLRGGVMQLDQGNWIALQRGDVVPDGRKVRTAGDGRLELVRGQERIALGGNTEIAIRDAAGQKMTSVVQNTGSVTITAERRNVQHFSVQTPVLAAVVKGTQFTVTYRNGEARVDVDRGVVQVQDNLHAMVADVTPGQSAAASASAPLDVNGPGSDRVVFLIDGAVVPAVARDAVVSGALRAEDALAAVETRGVPAAGAGTGNSGSGPSNDVVRSSTSETASEIYSSVGGSAGPSANVHAAPSSGGHGGGAVNASANAVANANANANLGAGSSAGIGVSAGPVGVDIGIGPGSHGNGNGAGANSGNGNGNGVGVNSGNGNGNGVGGNSGNGNGNGVGVNLGVVGVDAGSNGLGVGVGGNGGLRLGLGL